MKQTIDHEGCEPVMNIEVCDHGSLSSKQTTVHYGCLPVHPDKWPDHRWLSTKQRLDHDECLPIKPKEGLDLDCSSLKQLVDHDRFLPIIQKGCYNWSWLHMKLARYRDGCFSMIRKYMIIDDYRWHDQLMMKKV